MQKRNVVIHLLTSLCLCFIVALVVVSCGIFNGEVVAVSKSYRGVIYAGNESSGKVALMINVYWGTEYLESMLQILKEEDAKCTFFVGETWVKENPEMLAKIYNDGHEIGNHGSTHADHKKLSYSQNVKEIEACHDIVAKVTGVKMNLFAPPGGSYSAETVKAAEDLGYKTILWTHDTIDWRDKDADLIFSRATSELQSGDLILMHPTEATRDALKRIILAVKSKKLCLDTVSNTIKD